MDLLIKNGTVITGDGRTVIEDGHVWIKDGRIVAVEQGSAKLPEAPDVGEVIDATGCVVMPGVINNHAHGLTRGPTMPSGFPPYPYERTLYYLNRFLMDGTTTVMNVCGLSLMDDVASLQREHPVNLQIATAHTPANIEAAQVTDGSGLTERHTRATVEEVLEAGARAIGEIGGGQTLGGGAQDYQYIPAAVEAKTGISIHPLAAGELKVAVLGRNIDGEGAGDEGVAEVLRGIGLEGKLSVEEAKALIRDTVLPPLKIALKGFREAVEASARTGYPAVFHNSTPTAKLLLELAELHPQAKIIAGHSNHPLFTPEEAVSYARELKTRGVVIDISTLDCITTRRLAGPEHIDALIEAGVVDTISTDFAGGHWDGILECVHRIIRLKQLTLPAAIALATGNVANALPHLADGRGFLEKGKVADAVISDAVNVSRVKHVVISGKPAVRDGVALSRLPEQDAVAAGPQ